MDMPYEHRHRGESQLALGMSRCVLLVLAVQAILSMSLQIDETLTLVMRVIGVIGTVIVSVSFLIVQKWLISGHRGTAYNALRWLCILLPIGLLLCDVWSMTCVSIGLALMTVRWQWALAISVLPTVMLVSVLSEYWATVAITLAMAWLGGGVLYVLTRLCMVLRELATARERLARMQVDDERHRISRDLHDILGRSLVAVSLRVQTAIRLLDRDPVKCGQQLDEVAQMLAEGQAQLRGLTRGESVVSMAVELDSAGAVFSRLGVQCTVDNGARERELLDGLGARIVRECVTNLLKHSRPVQVSISLRDEPAHTVVTISNDGAQVHPRAGNGTGLRDLARRLEATGGSLQAGLVGGGQFRVVARLPREDAPATTHPTPVASQA
ncbi:MAG: sensor histidine kinase [Actinomycetales bacterium]